MQQYRIPLIVSAAGYPVSLLLLLWLPVPLVLLAPVLLSLVSLGIAGYIHRQELRAVRLEAGVLPPVPASASSSAPPRGTSEAAGAIPPVTEGHSPAAERSAYDSPAPSAEWEPALEYIAVIEESIISEGQKNTLDNEIVEKTLTLLARIARLVPQLQELNDSSINHNIQRLIFKDLNGAINPFLKLSGEAKRRNRRLLLDGIKDINSKLSLYVETMEQKDLLELQTRMELISERYRTTD